MVSRRAALRLIAPAAVLAAGGLGVWLTRPTPLARRAPRGEPLLRMPFRSGQVVLCQQGNDSPPGQTHALPNNQYAIDFSSAVDPTVIVTSAAFGRVVYALGGVDPDDFDAGFQYGNHVKIDHGDDYFTLYAHLDRVDVEVGMLTPAGARIGTMGSTGAAGGRHLHFSMQRGDNGSGGANGSIPMGAIVAADLTTGTGIDFHPFEGRSFRTGDRMPWQGHLYGSENDASRDPIEGAPPPDLAATLEAGRRALSAALVRRVRLGDLARGWRAHDPAWLEAELRPILAEEPEQPIALYLLAVAVLGKSGKLAEARVMLGRAVDANRAPHRREPWVDARAREELGAR